MYYAQGVYKSTPVERSEWVKVDLEASRANHCPPPLYQEVAEVQQLAAGVRQPAARVRQPAARVRQPERARYVVPVVDGLHDTEGCEAHDLGCSILKLRLVVERVPFSRQPTN